MKFLCIIGRYVIIISVSISFVRHFDITCKSNEIDFIINFFHCTTSSTFSLSMNNNPYNNTGDGVAYANTYDEYTYSRDQRMGQMQLTSVYKNSNDSTINLNETWGWIVGPNQNGSNVDIYLKGTTTSLHKCASSIGYISFGSATYIVKDISANLFVFQQAISPATDCNLALYYFHK